MYKIDRSGGAWGAVVQKSFTRTDPTTLGLIRSEILASWIRIRKNMRNPGSKGQNINQKLHIQTFLLSKPKSELLKNLNGSSGFSIKLTEIK